MGRAPCCDKTKVKKGPWSPEEDATLKNYIEKYGTGGNWIALPPKAGLKRCGKSCRLRWLNYLRPDIKRGGFTDEEDNIICTLYSKMGSRWSVMASNLPGRTDNDVKNHWNTKLKKKIMAATNHNNNTTLISSVNYNHNPCNSNPTTSTLHALSPSMDLFPKMGPNGAEVNLGTETNTQSLMQGLAHPAGLTTDQVCDQFQDPTSIINHMSSIWSEGNNESSSSGEFGFSMDLGTGYSLDDQGTISTGGFGTSYADLVNFLLS